LITVMAAVAGQ